MSTETEHLIREDRAGKRHVRLWVNDRDRLLAAGLMAGYPNLAAIAEKLGMNRVTFSRIANGHDPVSPAVATELRHLFGEHPVWLSER